MQIADQVEWAKHDGTREKAIKGENVMLHFRFIIVLLLLINFHRQARSWLPRETVTILTRNQMEPIEWNFSRN